MNISVTNIKPHIGASISLERDALTDPAVVARVREILEQRGVVVFPQIGFSDEEQIALTDKLGTRVKIFGGELGDDDSIYKISLDPKTAMHVEYVQATFFWHMDGLTAHVYPPKATLLSGRVISAKGGQTEFANTYIAYETLPDEMKAEIDGLRVVHSMRASMFDIFDTLDADSSHWGAMEPLEHPLVWSHESGRKSLVLAATADHIVGMPRADGRALLARLLQWTSQPDFCYSHPWREGDLVIWDNCGTLHRVVPYAADSGRLMHRTTIEGVEPLR